MLLPIPLLLSLFLGLVSLALVPLAMYALYRAYRQVQPRRYVVAERRAPREPARAQVVEVPLEPVVALRRPAVLIPLALGLLGLIISLGGRHLVQYAFPLGVDEPQNMRTGKVQYVNGPSNSNLRVESYGPENASTLVFTHGWGMDSTEWFYAKRDLAGQFHLILWDLPGLGKSKGPDDRDFSPESLARNLRAVIATANNKPVILVGHSIGGMTNLTFCRLFPETLGTEVAAIVQVDTSYTNPVKTAKNPDLNLMLQKPLAEPLLYAMIGLSPVVHAMNWMSYQNGSMSIMNANSSFAGAETRGQVDMVSRLQTEASPAVVARGTLGMFHWDASPVLATISVPVLILVGQQDTTTLPSASEHMAERIPKAKLVETAPGAHYSLLEQNQRIDSEIRRFVQGLQ